VKANRTQFFQKAKIDAIKAKRARQKVMKMKAFEKKAAGMASGDLPPSPLKSATSSVKGSSTQDADVIPLSSSVEIKNKKRLKTTSRPVIADASSPVAKKRRKYVTDSISFPFDDGMAVDIIKTVGRKSGERPDLSGGKTASTDKPRKIKLTSKSSGVSGKALGLLKKRKTAP
jgi:hypothetical protein